MSATQKEADLCIRRQFKMSPTKKYVTPAPLKLLSFSFEKLHLFCCFRLPDEAGCRQICVWRVLCLTVPTPEWRAGVKVPFPVLQTNSEGITGYIWCHKMPSCPNAFIWPSRAINGPNGHLNIAGGAHLEPSCLADGTRPGSPGHLSDSLQT